MKRNYSMLLACAGLTIMTSSVSAKTIREYVNEGMITQSGATATWIGPEASEELVLVYKTPSSQPHNLTIDSSLAITADWLVVSGGGAGGTIQSGTARGGDGGNSGNVLHTENGTLKGASYDIYVGKGGDRVTSQSGEVPGGDGEMSAFVGEGVNDVADGGKGGAAKKTGISSGKDGTSVDFTSEITGTSVTYAHGGAGGVGDGSHDRDGERGADNTGNGGGGGDKGRIGGDGGSGIVVIRLKSAESHATNGPELKELTYDGTEQIGIEEGTGYVIGEGSVVKATNAGSYVAKVTPAAGWWWADDQSTSEREITWTISPKEIDRPSAEPAMYNFDPARTEPYTVQRREDPAYTYVEEETVTSATESGLYKLTAELNNSESVTNYVWKGETEYHAVAIGFWQVAPHRSPRPTYLSEVTYTGNEIESVNVVAPVMTTQTPLQEESVTRATDVGRYEFVLKPGPDDKNYIWEDTLDANPWDVMWEIKQAENVLEKFQQDGWRIVEGITPPAPIVRAKFGETTALITYAPSEDTPLEDWTTEQPTTSGTWWARAEIPPTPNYTGAEATTSFVVWETAEDIYTDSVEISTSGYTGNETLTDFVIPVRLSEAALPGFSYARVGGPDKLAFVADDKTLSYDVELWNPAGESIVWVKVPELKSTTKLTMWWHAKIGFALGGLDPKEVWKNYHGVWHFGEQLDSVTAIKPTIDATQNGYDAVPTTYNEAAPTSKMISVPGVIGLARQSADATTAKGSRFELKNTAALRLGERFTVSGWYNMQRLGSADSLALITRKTAQSASGGWYGQHNSSSTITLYGQGSGSAGVASASIRNVQPQTAGWIYFAYTFDGTTLKVMQTNNGVTKTNTGTVQAPTDNGKTITLGAYVYDEANNKQVFAGYFDEVRISKEPIAESRLEVERQSMTDPAFVSAGLVTVDGKKVNQWVTLPTIDPVAWDVAEEPTFTINMGTLVEGTTKVNYYRVDDLENPLPIAHPSEIENAGQYVAVFTMEDAEGYEPIRHEIALAVSRHEPYTDLSGNEGDSGRVLLMNRDLKPASPIDYQGFYDTNPAEATVYWEHLNEEGEAKFHLKSPTKSILRKKDGTRLWTIVDCRHGNVFPVSDTLPLPASQVFLPWQSPTALRFDGRGEAATKRSDAGTLVMRNAVGSTVYSPVFTEGIGTIYFDAVNGWVPEATDDGSAYRLVVETSELVNTDDPQDIEDVDWVQVPGVTLYKKDNGAAFETEKVEGGEFKLAIRHGGTVENFYRVAVTLNSTKPVRFRIRRASFDDTQDKDSTRMISLDNLIVSYPPMRADLSPTGFYDETKRGNQVAGWENAMTVAYPSITDKEVYARAKMTAVTNSGAPVEDPRQLIASTVMNYRWRYLGQKLEPTEGWKRVALDPMNDFVSTQPLKIPATAGDVEFWYETLLSAPYYQYVDYTGLELGVPESEEVGFVTNRREGITLPSGGKDWFFRLREGKSGYSNVRLIATPATVNEEEGPVEKIVKFEVTKDGLWRGFLKTDETMKGKWLIRLETEEPVDEKGIDPALKLRTFKTVEPLEPGAAKALSANYIPALETEWGTVEVDAGTGYLMFQVNEDTKTVSVAHADYQNFNAWNDAHRDGGVFVGNSTDENRVGVSASARDFAEDFATWTDTPDTNNYWQEPFTSSSQLEVFTPFQNKSTPNGWLANNGMFVNEKWMQQNQNYAFQMMGQGFGSIEFPGAPVNPRGIEKVTYRARLGQQLSFNDIGYKDVGKREAGEMTNYTFVAHPCMTDNADASNVDGNAQISIVAGYQSGKGCYELRATRTGDHTARVELYKWRYNAGGTMTATRLAGPTNVGGNDFMRRWRPNASSEWCYSTLFLSFDQQADGSVKLIGGASTSHVKMGSLPPEFTLIEVTDAAANKPLTFGTFGVASANCPSRILAPRAYDAAVTRSGNTITWNGTCTDESPSVIAAEWTCPEARLEPFSDTEARVDRWGFQGLATTQKLLFQQKLVNTSEWVTLAERDISGFTLTALQSIDLYRTEDATYRFVHGGSIDDARTDIVIDSIQLYQWRGDTYGSRDTQGWCDPNDGYGYRSSFYFTSGWIKNHKLKLSAKRTGSSEKSALRSPLMDGNNGRGIGLGMISVGYRNAQANARLLVQVAEAPNGSALVSEDAWETKGVIDFSTMSGYDREAGVVSHYLGLHGFKGMVRLIVDPMLVMEVSGETDPRRFGEVEIENVLVRDEPALDIKSWWGWNLRLLNGDNSSAFDDGSRTYLPDWGVNAGDMGLSLALNNSTSANVIRGEADAYRQHMPFVQTPTFNEDIVGEVTFKARKFDSTNPQAAEIRLYGAPQGDVPPTDPLMIDSGWTELAHFTVTNDVYETFHFRSPGESYKAFRFGVSGVSGVVPGARGPAPTEGDEPVRVMIDEVVVSEAVYPLVGFRYAYPARTGLETHEKSPVFDFDTGLPLCDEQPLLGENWTVQAEIQVKQLPEEIDLDTPGHEPIVRLHWYQAMSPWGFANWKDMPAAKSAELTPIDGDNRTFRGSFARTPDAVVGESEEEGTAVQYMVSVTYYDKEGARHTAYLRADEWTTPEWYNPVDHNKGQPLFSAFTILESIAPHRAWINEVNVYDGTDASYQNFAKDDQYVELAVPLNQSLDGWTLEYVDNARDVRTLCSFGDGAGQIPGMKGLDGPTTNDYTFLVIQSPLTRDGSVWQGAKRPIDGGDVKMDGTWGTAVGERGELEGFFPVALRLVRPSGIVAHEIAFEGYNLYDNAPAWHFTLEDYVDDVNADVEKFPEQSCFAAGREKENQLKKGLEGQSLGVFTKIGKTADEWNAVMHQTPGWWNEDQEIPENYVIYPNRAQVVLTAMVAGKGVTQSVDGGEATTEGVKLTVPKGGAGVEIVYEIGTWHELKNVTENEAPVTGSEGARGTYTVTVGAGALVNTTVVATSQPRSDLSDYGFDPEGPFADAIMDWLDKGVNYFGQRFKNPGEIHPSEYWSLTPYAKQSELSLTEMYWLDIDPTEGDWRLEAGITKVMTKQKPQPVMFAIGPDGEDHEGEATHDETQNLLVTVKMTLTNTVSNVSHAPYILRGREAGETSVSHETDAEANWRSASFKVTGDLQNGNPNRTRWVPLRWFYFLPDASKPNKSASFNALNEAEIEVWDPFDEERTGTTSGWSKYRGTPVFYRWAIDERLMPTQVEGLKPDSRF